MAEFLAMGGYAFHVWGAYGLVAAVLVGNAVWAWRRHRRASTRPSEKSPG